MSVHYLTREFSGLELPQEMSTFHSLERMLKVVRVCLLRIFAAPRSPSTYEEREAKPGYDIG